ncbi:MAG: terpene cyclase/mutase family protein, partial [Sedimentisphaerales bacterium]|nr:terpene cyclase/mutase family protein [Sedimentisphaerales bacterium]
MKRGRHRRVGLAAVVAIAVVLVAVAPAGCGQGRSADSQQQVVERAAERLSGWLEEHVTHIGTADDDFVTVMDNLYDWPEIGLVRHDGSGFADYLPLTEQYVRGSWQESDGYHKATDLERLILAVSAAGGNPRDVSGHDLIAALCNHSRFDLQGANSAIFGLIALDCKGYPLAEGTLRTREKMLELALGYRLPDGSFSLTGDGEGDPDITAMAIQALWRYADDAEIGQVLDDAVAWLSRAQCDGGGYASWGVVNSESAAQVIIALSCMGIDVTSDPRFSRDGKDALSFLLICQQPGGGFCHVPGAQSDKVASEEAMLALAAWLRLKDGRSALYD